MIPSTRRITRQAGSSMDLKNEPASPAARRRLRTPMWHGTNCSPFSAPFTGACAVDRSAFRPDDDVLGLTGRPGEEEEISLTEMEDHAAAVTAGKADTCALAEWLAERYAESGIGSAAAIAKRLAPLAEYELADARRNLLS